MSIKLYGYWRSSATYRVRLALNLKQLAYEYVPIHLLKDGGQQHANMYCALNPAKLLPTYYDDDIDVILNQSLAIIEYIDEKHPERCRLIPQHSLERARVRTLSQDIACDIQPLANLRVLNRLSAQFDAAEQDRNQWARHWLEQGFTAIEQRLQNTAGDYCFGFDLSMADICLVPQVYNARKYAIDMAQFPLISRIDKNCQALDEFIQARPENQPDATRTDQ